jgi:rhamnogalacturonan endolyase
VHDARTGQIIYGASGDGADVGRGVVGDIIASSPGMEVWGSRGGLLKANGQSQTSRPGQMNFMVWWDGDLSREILDGTTISKWNEGSNSVSQLLAASGAASNNSTKSTPSLSADIFGDWREEVIWRNANNRQLMIYTTTIPTSQRIHTLMHDPQYRVAIAWQNTGYNQPPHPSFFLGNDMGPVVKPNIHLTGDEAATTTENILRIQESTAGSCSSLTPETDNGGYTGTGYINTPNATGETLSWAVNVPTSDTYMVSIRFAGVSDRAANVIVNGNNAGNAPFANTGAWTSWKSQTLQLALKAGNNTIALQSTANEGLANIDVLEVWHTGAKAGNCP